MNYEEIDSLLKEATAAYQKELIYEAERLCNAALENLPILQNNGADLTRGVYRHNKSSHDCTE